MAGPCIEARPVAVSNPGIIDANALDQNADNKVSIGEFYAFGDDGRDLYSFPILFSCCVRLG